MSYDLSGQSPRCPTCGHESWNWDWNYTSNSARTWREAGADLAEFDGKTGEECAPILERAIATMRDEPERFRAHDSPNGWGNYATLLPALERLLRHLCEYPKSVVRVSR